MKYCTALFGLFLFFTSHLSLALSSDKSYANFDYPISHTYFVSPKGDDNHPGTKYAPFRTINKALEYAEAGERVYLLEGEYYQDVRTVRSGTADKPILIHGSKKAVLKGESGGRVFQVNHDYIHLRGFTINGLVGDGKSENDYRKSLIFVHGTETRKGPEGFVLRAMRIRNAGGECVRLRYYVTKAEIFGNTFYNCGAHDFQLEGRGKNGEAIYIGTASGQWHDGKKPTGDPDHSNYNWVHHNYFLTRGNECVDIKEGAENNLVENNICAGQQDPDSGGFDARGDYNIIRYNISYENKGAGVRIGGNLVKGKQYGVYNEVYGNKLYDNENAGVKVMAYPQQYICGNAMGDNSKGDIGGDSATFYDPDHRC
ncbi:right-handed parallel beta-helix repeat-containing protein [Hahella ganghwensis]|uniref:right-handed parallel beta-helix repeat-containing protein n=1 Tax=Hahella ganghwensis TaxID=286420 RepID=UPI00036CBE5E|nr:right-handed parallel beta-helix repeat-containing protein [Hahella ganghwensis]